MSIEQSSQFFKSFQLGVDQIRASETTDDLHLKLYISYIVSLMEKYLSDVFIYEISTNRENLMRLATHPKFRQQKLTLPYVLNHDVEAYLITSVKNLVWHRLNDVETLYKHVLDIDMNIQRELLEKLKLRHDIVHRNGYSIDNQLIVVTHQQLCDCIRLFVSFVKEVDANFIKYNTSS